MSTSKILHANLHANLLRMVAIQVRDVPGAIRDDLMRAARERGQSLQVFLREVLEVEARKSRNREFLRSIAPIPVSGERSSDRIAELIREGRGERDGHIMDALGKPDDS
ncbi:hypothetical protein [Microbacterium sp. PMB16]|uniref:hypothetical protein n=1 Tax=Microbacterium sp. PMB16 TaxID=3120157 RepID=UPI003F4B5E67